MKKLLFSSALLLATLKLSAQCNGVFYDDFETGALAAGWSLGTGHTVSVNTTAPAVGAYSMNSTGSSAFYAGPNVLFTSSQPTYVSWRIKTNTVNAANAYFVLGDANINSDNGILFAYCNASSGLRFFASTGYNHPITANTWYHVEVMNINWTTRTMDIYVDGVLILPGWPFRSGTATSMDRLHAFNLNAATASYDNIIIGGIPVTLSNVTTSPTCNGATTGGIDLTVTGGTAPFTYSWSNSATTEDITGVGAGTYSVTVTDNLGCITTSSFTITEPTALALSFTSTNVTCFAGTDGSADLTVSGGTPGYSYSWSSGATTEDESNLAAGTYTLVLTDANGCTSVLSGITITEPSEILATVSTTDVTCNGGSDGSATVTPTGGIPGYTYSWAPAGGTNATATGLPAGGYTCTITDNNGCVRPQTLSINEPTAIAGTISGTDVTCNAGSDGSAMIIVSGGSPGYTYSWMPSGGTADMATGLIAGTYTCTVTDLNGCTFAENITITEPTPIVATTSSTNVTCFSGNDASALVSVSGGSPGYAYLWSNGDTLSMTDSLVAGSYSCTVTDANGCTSIQSVTITEPPQIVISLSVTNATTCGGNDGAIDATINGGTAPYTYLWSTTATTEDISALTAGSYSITVTDTNGCTATNGADVLNPPLPTVSLTFTTSTYCLDDATVTLTGGSPAGGTWSGPGVTAGMFDPSAAGNGTHTITYSFTDGNNCTATATNSLTVNACVGIIENASTTWNVYPNPNNGTFTLSTNSISGDVIVEVTDIQGRIIFHENENNVTPRFTKQISLEGVSTGLYMLRVMNTAHSTIEIYKISVQ